VCVTPYSLVYDIFLFSSVFVVARGRHVVTSSSMVCNGFVFALARGGHVVC
jgi:hypothetical protein